MLVLNLPDLQIILLKRDSRNDKPIKVQGWFLFKSPSQMSESAPVRELFISRWGREWITLVKQSLFKKDEWYFCSSTVSWCWSQPGARFWSYLGHPALCWIQALTTPGISNHTSLWRLLEDTSLSVSYFICTYTSVGTRFGTTCLFTHLPDFGTPLLVSFFEYSLLLLPFTSECSNRFFVTFH